MSEMRCVKKLSLGENLIWDQPMIIDLFTAKKIIFSWTYLFEVPD